MMFFYEIFISLKNSISYYFGLVQVEPIQCSPRRKVSLKKSLTSTRKQYINVAVTGSVNSGKSTLVDAMRGIDEEEEGAEPRAAGVSYKGLPQSYIYPGNSRILLWDLPGIEASEIKQHAYVEKVDLRSYDFFILTSSGRMDDELLYLAKEISRMGKSFLFARTKIDIYVSDTQQQHNFNQGDLLREIRKHFCKKLQAIGIHFPHVFLLSALEPDKFDFQDFIEAFNSQF
ncbi:interferon-inducible GTPase 5-like [Rhincodon typus]|uniref:interferon-inducible GTPase 5-like n=1 Tax=Rhincodon typus TaxID=259920 RepID=UPI00202E92A8|nr:interferon-inducible GTPase 5-like [Rhincodon typus]